MLSLWCLLGVAEAGPYGMLQPAGIMARGETEMAAGVTYLANPSALDRGQGFLGAWARYGFLDRLEVSGGAYLPWFSDVGVHGNARYLLVGEAGADGPSLSTGFGMGTWFSNLANFTFTVPLTVGVRNGNTDLFAGPVVSAYPLGDAGTVIAWSIEAGGAVTTSGFPIYASLVYGQTFGVDLIGFNIGFGYNLKM